MLSEKIIFYLTLVLYYISFFLYGASFFSIIDWPKEDKKALVVLPFLHYCCSVCTNRGSKKGEWLWTQLMSKYWFFPYLSFGLCPYFLLFCLHHQMFLTSYSIHVLHQIKLLFSSTSTGEQIVELQATNLKNLVTSWIVQKTEVVGSRTPEDPEGKYRLGSIGPNPKWQSRG